MRMLALMLMLVLTLVLVLALALVLVLMLMLALVLVLVLMLAITIKEKLKKENNYFFILRSIVLGFTSVAGVVHMESCFARSICILPIRSVSSFTDSEFLGFSHVVPGPQRFTPHELILSYLLYFCL